MELEQMLEHTPISATDSGTYNTIDTYAQGTTPLYGSNVFDRPLTIRDMPSSGVQLHIHEGPGGSGHLKTYKGERIKLNSYDSAMADLLADNIDLKKYGR